ncbi:MAG: hypothetical protein Q9219_000292 [cf. Caloplaca sp. 3 TL-2023]
MSHEPSVSDTDTSPPLHQLSENVSSSRSSQEELAAATASAEHGDSEQHARKANKKHKTQYFDHLLRQIDIMIYCELSILYYMDCSLFSFIARALNHWFYFTPKPSLVSPVITWHRPHIVMIFALNLLSIFLHAVNTPPTAGEAVRGYLHGGLLIDFVGQKSPVSRWRLVGYDALILVLQLVMLGVAAEKKKLDATGGASADGNGSREGESQDHDSEERGVRRSEEGAEGIEMQSLHPGSRGRTGGEEDGERDELLGIEGSTASEHPRDEFYSGQYMLANIHIVDTIKEQWSQSYPTADGNSRDGSMGTAAAAELARRRLRFRIRIGGRDYGS